MGRTEIEQNGLRLFGFGARSGHRKNRKKVSEKKTEPMRLRIPRPPGLEAESRTKTSIRPGIRIRKRESEKRNPESEQGENKSRAQRLNFKEMKIDQGLSEPYNKWINQTALGRHGACFRKPRAGDAPGFRFPAEALRPCSLVIHALYGRMKESDLTKRSGISDPD